MSGFFPGSLRDIRIDDANAFRVRTADGSLTVFGVDTDAEQVVVTSSQSGAFQVVEQGSGTLFSVDADTPQINLNADVLSNNAAIFDVTAAVALQVRVAGDSGDVFTVDTSTPIVQVDSRLDVDVADGNAFRVMDGGNTVLNVSTSDAGDNYSLTLEENTELALDTSLQTPDRHLQLRNTNAGSFGGDTALPSPEIRLQGRFYDLGADTNTTIRHQIQEVPTASADSDLEIQDDGGSTLVRINQAGEMTLTDDLVVGSDIGVSGDTDLLQLAADTMRLNGSLSLNAAHSAGAIQTHGTAIGSLAVVQDITNDSDTVAWRVRDSNDNTVGDLAARNLDGSGAGELHIEGYDTVDIDNGVTMGGDLVVGSDIGVSGDTDLLQLAADTLTVNGTVSATTVDANQLESSGQEWVAFVVAVRNNGGTLEGRIGAPSSGSTASNFDDPVTSPSQTMTAIPQVDGTTDFTNSLGVDASNTNNLLIETTNEAPTLANLQYTASVARNDSADDLTLTATVSTVDVNGTTRRWITLLARDSAGNWAWSTGSLANGEWVVVQITGFMP